MHSNSVGGSSKMCIYDVVTELGGEYVHSEECEAVTSWEVGV